MSIFVHSLSWNHNGDVSCGSLNCRKNYDTPILPTAFTDEEGHSSLTGVFVLRELSQEFSLNISILNEESTAISGTIFAADSNGNIIHDIAIMGIRLGAEEITPATLSITTSDLRNNCSEDSLYHSEIEAYWFFKEGTYEPYCIGITLLSLYFLPLLPVRNYPGSPNIIWETSCEKYAQNERKYIWTDLLDICCRAADIYEEETRARPENSFQITAALVYELNTCQKFSYDTRHGASYYVHKFDFGNIVHLQQYINDRNQLFSNKLNCTDCASLIAYECLACGLPATTAVMDNPIQPDSGFGCNPIIAIGCDSWAVPFDFGFSYHEVLTLDNFRVLNTPVFDACLLLDAGPYPHVSNPVNKKPDLALGKNFSETASLQVNVNPTQPYTLDYYRERLVASGESCFFNDEVRLIAGFKITPFLSADFENFERQLSEIKFLAAAQNWILTANYETILVYQEKKDTEILRIEFMLAENSLNAEILLRNKLAAVSHPAVQRTPGKDIHYHINDTWHLFIQNNTVVQVSGDTSEAANLMEVIKKQL